jgi:hypothetical protein
MTQTSMEWFIEQLPIRVINMYQEEIDKAKLKEREQIKLAYAYGQQNGRECELKLAKGEDCNVITSTQYYNEQYGK